MNLDLLAYEEFLAGVIQEEVSAIPRGAHGAVRQAGSSTSGQKKMLAGVPPLLKAEFDKNRAPKLRPHTAGKTFTNHPPFVVLWSISLWPLCRGHPPPKCS